MRLHVVSRSSGLQAAVTRVVVTLTDLVGSHRGAHPRTGQNAVCVTGALAGSCSGKDDLPIALEHT